MSEKYSVKYNDIVSVDMTSIPKVEGNDPLIITVNTKTGSANVTLDNSFDAYRIIQFAELTVQTAIEEGKLYHSVFKAVELFMFLSFFSDIDLESEEINILQMPFVGWVEDLYSIATQSCLEGRYAMLKLETKLQYERTFNKLNSYTLTDLFAVQLTTVVEKASLLLDQISDNVTNMSTADMNELIKNIKDIPLDKLGAITTDSTVQNFVKNLYQEEKKEARKTTKKTKKTKDTKELS